MASEEQPPYVRFALEVLTEEWRGLPVVEQIGLLVAAHAHANIWWLEGRSGGSSWEDMATVGSELSSCQRAAEEAWARFKALGFAERYEALIAADPKDRKIRLDVLFTESDEASRTLVSERSELVTRLRAIASS